MCCSRPTRWCGARGSRYGLRTKHHSRARRRCPISRRNSRRRQLRATRRRPTSRPAGTKHSPKPSGNCRYRSWVSRRSSSADPGGSCSSCTRPATTRQYDLDPKLVDHVRESVKAAAGEAGAVGEEQENWAAWSREMYADAFAATFAGAATRDAVEELELRDGRGALISPAGTYPPPVVRLAVIDTVLAITRGADPHRRSRQLVPERPEIPAQLAETTPKPAAPGSEGRGRTRRLSGEMHAAGTRCEHRGLGSASQRVARRAARRSTSVGQHRRGAAVRGGCAMHAWRRMSASEDPPSDERGNPRPQSHRHAREIPRGGNTGGQADATSVDAKTVVDVLFDNDRAPV